MEHYAGIDVSLEYSSVRCGRDLPDEAKCRRRLATSGQRHQARGEPVRTMPPRGAMVSITRRNFRRNA